MEFQIIPVVVTILTTSVVQSLFTVVVLKTSIRYIEKDIERIDKSVTRAHARLDVS